MATILLVIHVFLAIALVVLYRTVTMYHAYTAHPQFADRMGGLGVALLFQVSERAVTDWARRGRLPSVRTPGGHRRYPATAVRELLESVGLRPR